MESLRGCALKLLVVLGWMVSAWACTQDEPAQERQEDQTPRGALVIETLLTSCDLRAADAVCRSNDVCGVCKVGGFDVWYWRETGACRWVFTDAGQTPNTDPEGEASPWVICQDAGGPMDQRTDTP